MIDAGGVRRPDLWGLEGDEYLYKIDPDEVVADFVENRLLPGEQPETLVVVGYARRELALHAETILEQVIDNLDDEYAGEDATEPTQRMKEAAEQFAQVMREEYRVWQCEPVCRETINLGDWMSENGYIEGVICTSADDDADYERYQEMPNCPECNGRGNAMEGWPCEYCDGTGRIDV